MSEISQEQFEAVVAARAADEAEPLVENDQGWKYEIFHDKDGVEIGFAAYHSEFPTKYVVH